MTGALIYESMAEAATLDATSTHNMHDSRNSQQNQRYDEDDLGNRGCRTSDATKTQNSRDDGDNQKSKSPTKHDILLCDVSVIRELFAARMVATGQTILSGTYIFEAAKRLVR
jgi:hypothetical protein